MFREDKALAYLLGEGILIVLSLPIVENPWEEKDKWELIEGEAIVVQVITSDVFAWGYCASDNISSSDSIGTEKNELYDLLRLHLEDKRWGSTKWICFKCNKQPQYPIIRDMKKEGAWDEKMEALPENPWNEPYKKEVKDVG